jgi:hypothetical protein
MNIPFNSALLLPLGTAMGAFGGFPPAPPIWAKLSAHPAFQFFALYVLVWQGGAQQDVQTALLTTAIVFGILMLLKNWAPAAVVAESPAKEGYCNGKPHM